MRRTVLGRGAMSAFNLTARGDDSTGSVAYDPYQLLTRSLCRECLDG
jgi:hypothetical protein